MSATRLLVLGLVRALGTAHGYRIHGELVSWGADKWANVKWGSIYHALRQLAKEGRLRVHDAECTGRVDYSITPEGETEFMRLLRTALRVPEPRQDMLAAGLVFLPALRREDAIGLLRERVRAIEAVLDDLRASLPAPGDPALPAHVRELFGMWLHQTEASADWARSLADRLAAGAYVMAGEEGFEESFPLGPAAGAAPAFPPGVPAGPDPDPLRPQD